MHNKVLFAVIFTVFVDLIGFGILIPIIPQLLANPASPFYLFHGGWSVQQGYILFGFLMAVFPFMQFLATPVLGQLSDRFGRKPILAFSLFGTCISYLLFVLGIVLHNIPLLFFARGLDGLTGGNIAVAQAAIADISTPQNRAKNFGLMGAAFGLGFIIGPYLGGVLSDPNTVPWFNATTPFFFAAALSFVNVLSVIFLLPETHKTRTKKLVLRWAQSFINIGRAVRLPGMGPIFTSVFLFQAGFTFFTTFFSVFLITKFGFTQGSIGNYFAFMGLWIAFSQAVITRRVSKRFSEWQILRFSLVATGLVMLAQFVPTVWWGLLFIVPFFAMTVGLSQANTSALVSRAVGPEMQGQILGVNASVQALAQTIPPILSGYIAASIAPGAPIVVAAITILLGGFVFIMFVPKPKMV